MQPINLTRNWRLTHQRKQAQIDKDILCKNSTRVDQDYIIGDWFMVRGKMTLNMEHYLKFRTKLLNPRQMEMLPFR